MQFNILFSDLSQLISNAFERVLESTTLEQIQIIQNSTLESLKAHQCDEDLIKQFNNEFSLLVTQWENTHRKISTIISGDNFNEESMDVDNSQEEQQTVKPKRKSRFSNALPQETNDMSKEKDFSRDERSYVSH